MISLVPPAAEEKQRGKRGEAKEVKPQNRIIWIFAQLRVRECSPGTQERPAHPPRLSWKDPNHILHLRSNLLQRTARNDTWHLYSLQHSPGLTPTSWNLPGSTSLAAGEGSAPPGKGSWRSPAATGTQPQPLLWAGMRLRRVLTLGRAPSPPGKGLCSCLWHFLSCEEFQSLPMPRAKA